MAARFEFDSLPTPGTFIVEIADEKNIAHARRVLSGQEKTAIHIGGVIVLSTVPYNPSWAFHIDPSTVRFFETSMPQTDLPLDIIQLTPGMGRTRMPGGLWMPSKSRLLREVK